MKLKALIALAQQKDLGLTEFYLAYSMRQVVRFVTLSAMPSPVTLEELRVFILGWPTIYCRRSTRPHDLSIQHRHLHLGLQDRHRIDPEDVL